MADVVQRAKALVVNPLKVSQPVGASLAFLGLARAMPLEHGARGCTAFNKLFFMRHFREPIALQTTAMDVTTVVMGADENVVQALETICAQHHPGCSPRCCRKMRCSMSFYLDLSREGILSCRKLKSLRIYFTSICS